MRRPAGWERRPDRVQRPAAGPLTRRSRAGWPGLAIVAAGLLIAGLLLGGVPTGLPVRVLLLLLALALVTYGAAVQKAGSDQSRRLDELIDIAEEIAAGSIHRFVPGARRGIVGRLAGAINRVADLARAERLALEPERVVDRTIVREAPDGVLVVNVGGSVRRCNPAAQRLLALAEDPAGRSLAEIAPPDVVRVAEEVTRRRQLVEAATTVGRLEIRVRGVPLADGADCLMLMHDISSLRRAERARRDFVANVSHELKTPITTILAYLETLDAEAHALPPDTLMMLDVIRRNAERLNALTEDVLQLSRLEARTSDLPLEDEPIAPVVAEVVERHAHKAAHRGVVVDVHVPATLHAAINADALDNALGNLLDNAIKYGGDGGRVRIVAEAVGGAVEIHVQDFGRGVDPVHHDRLFERFYRVDEGRARGLGGTGLGLALVKHLCLSMRAEVRVQSAVGEGATFTLRLPIAGSR